MFYEDDDDDVSCLVSTGCQSTVDLAFLVDSSGSINDANPNNWNITLNFVITLIDRFVISAAATHVALIRFSNIGEVIFRLNTYYTRLILFILSLHL